MFIRCVELLLVLCCLPPPPAFADVLPFPPEKPSASISMKDATVEVRLYAENKRIKAEVRGRFVMQKSPENLPAGDAEVLFPLSRAVLFGFEKGPPPVLTQSQTDAQNAAIKKANAAGDAEKFAVTVDGRPVAGKRSEWGSRTVRFFGYDWAVDFNQGRHQIDVQYTVVLDAYAENGKPNFTYFLTSGANWSGPIGREVVHVVAGKGLAMKIVSPERIKPKVQKDDEITWEIVNAKPGEDIELAVSADTAGENDADQRLVCPEPGYLNCQPIVTAPRRQACSKKGLEWIKANCPDVQVVF